MYFREEASQNTIPYFITLNSSNGTIGGMAVDADVCTFSLECVGLDDAKWETVIPFSLIVKSNI